MYSCMYVCIRTYVCMYAPFVNQSAPHESARYQNDKQNKRRNKRRNKEAVPKEHEEGDEIRFRSFYR